MGCALGSWRRPPRPRAREARVLHLAPAPRPEPTPPHARPRATAWVNISSCRTGLRNVRWPAASGRGAASGAHRSLMSLTQPPLCRRGNRGWRGQGLALGPSVSGRASHHLCFPFIFFGGLCFCLRLREAGQRALDWESGPQVPGLVLPSSACNSGMLLSAPGPPSSFISGIPAPCHCAPRPLVRLSSHSGPHTPQSPGARWRGRV